MNRETIIFLMLLITAHCLSDLLLRPKNGSKSRSLHYFLFLHSGIHFIVGLALTVFMLSVASLVTLLAVAVSHYLIDLFKTKIMRASIKQGTVVDIVDQLMHFAAIFILTHLLYGL